MQQAVGTAIVVGSINRDIVAYVEHHPSPGETVLTARGNLFPGGKGANQAVAIARMGGAVSFIGRVGDDVFGAEMRAFMAGEGVDVADVATVAGTTTGLGLITVDASGQNAITVLSGANQTWDTLPSSFHAAARDIVVCQLEIPLPVVLAAFRQAKSAGALTVLNAAPFRPLGLDILDATDILVVNQLEAAALAGRSMRDGFDTALALSERIGLLLDLGPQLVVVTLGADGVCLAGRDVPETRIPGRGVAAVDTTGAGDCFVGAFVAELLRGNDAAAAARTANAAAAISVTRKGAATALPTRTEVEHALATERQS